MKKLFLATIFIMLATLGHAQSAPVPSYDFDYTLVAIDAQTKGKVSLDTKQIELGVLIENKSKNIPLSSMVEFRFDEANLRTGRGLYLQAIESKNGYSTSGFRAMGKTFIFANVSPTVITKKLPKDVVLANVTITATVTSGVDGTKTIVRKFTEDIVYTFSNDELIPQIVRNIK